MFLVCIFPPATVRTAYKNSSITADAAFIIAHNESSLLACRAANQCVLSAFWTRKVNDSWPALSIFFMHVSPRMLGFSKTTYTPERLMRVHFLRPVVLLAALR